jgi:hypothetical protein
VLTLVLYTFTDPILQRMDTVANNEDYDAALEDWSPKLRVKTCLKSLQICKMEGYQGGKLESDFASAVLVKWTSPDVSVERRLNPLVSN